jgi:hypothetical protein
VVRTGSGLCPMAGYDSCVDPSDPATGELIPIRFSRRLVATALCHISAQP